MLNRIGVRAVVFDAVGTLIHPHPPAAAVYTDAGVRFGSQYGFQEVGPRFRAAFQKQEAIDQQRGLRTCEARESERWRCIVAEVLDDVANPDDCFVHLYSHFGRTSSWRCEPDAGFLLQELTSRGYFLAMASNYDARLRSVVAGLPELVPLHNLIISSEIGWRKPAREFFSKVIDRLGCLPREILYIGDDPSNDYQGALGAGLQAILFDPGRKYLERVDHRLDALKDLLSLL